MILNNGNNMWLNEMNSVVNNIQNDEIFAKNNFYMFEKFVFVLQSLYLPVQKKNCVLKIVM